MNLGENTNAASRSAREPSSSRRADPKASSGAGQRNRICRSAYGSHADCRDGAGHSDHSASTNEQQMTTDIVGSLGLRGIWNMSNANCQISRILGNLE